MSANGCGPAWMPLWLKQMLFNWFFEASCNKHDHGYGQGGNEVRRFECDWKFALAMHRDMKRLSWHLKPLACLTGLLFYLLVRNLGWLQFRYKGREPLSQAFTHKVKRLFCSKAQ